MFKKFIVLLFFVNAFFFNFSFLAAEEKQQKDDTRILYLIKLEKPGSEKSYKVLINNDEWFKKWKADDALMIIELGQGDGFVKPSYVKKIRKDNS